MRRHADAVHFPPARRGRKGGPRRPADEAGEPETGERRLAAVIRHLRRDAASLGAYLRCLPIVERHTARLVLIRELGARRAGEILGAGAGRPLPAPLQAPIAAAAGEAALFARLHSGDDAAALAAAFGARAVTLGDHVFFGAGQLRPGDPAGDALIAHEAAHVAQGRRGQLARAAAKALDGGVADAAELEADLAAQLVAQKTTPPAAPPPAAAATGLAESEAQRAAQLQAQAQRLAAAKPTPAPAPSPAPTPTASTPLPSAAAEKAPAAAAKPPARKSPYLDLFAAAPSKMAADWDTVGAKASEAFRSEEQAAAARLPALEARLTGGAPRDKAPAPAAAGGAAPELPKAAPAPRPTPPPAPPAPPLPKSPAGELATRVVSEDKKQLEAAGKQALEAIPTRDPAPPRRPGPPPVIELCGEADPVRAATAEGEGVSRSEKAADAAKQAVLRGPGAAQVQPKALDEKLRVPPPEAPPDLPSPPPVEGMEELRAYRLDAAATRAFDEQARPVLEARLAAARAQVEEAGAARERARGEAVEHARKETATANRQAAEKRAAEVQAARKQIVDEQNATVQKQRAAVDELKQTSAARRTEANQKIDARVKADQQQIADAYKDAEKKAEAEHQKGEAEASKKKEAARAQARDKSWWARAKAAVCEAIKAVADAVCQILAEVRKAIDRLIDGVKQLACRLIDAARDFIKSAISAFGDWLKSQVTALLGSVLPGLAARLNAFIGRAVAAARRAVDQVADGLKKAVTALCEGLKKAVAGLVAAFQSAVRAAAALATALVKGDWKTVARMVLEGILKLIGVDAKAFWALVGKAEASLKQIVANPRGFVVNLVGAVKSGFELFGKNLWTHLKNGLVNWLVNSMSSAGITLPARLDFAGVFDITLQVLGLTRERLRQKAVRLVGEKNVARLEKLWGLVEPLVKNGLGGLWDKLKQDLSGLEEAVIGQLRSWLVEKVVLNAVVKIASLFNPAGAIAQLILTAWKVYCWLRDNALRIVGLVQSVVDSMAEIVEGKLDKAARLIEKSLGQLVPIAIDLFANLLGLGGLGARIKEILGSVHKRIDAAIDKLLQRLMGQSPSGDGKSDAQKSDAVKDKAASQIASRLRDETEAKPEPIARAVKEVYAGLQKEGLKAIWLEADVAKPGEFQVWVQASPRKRAHTFRVRDLNLAESSTALIARLNGKSIQRFKSWSKNVKLADGSDEHRGKHAERALVDDLEKHWDWYAANFGLVPNQENRLEIEISRSPCPQCKEALLAFLERRREYQIKPVLKMASFYKGGDRNENFKVLKELRAAGFDLSVTTLQQILTKQAQRNVTAFISALVLNGKEITYDHPEKGRRMARPIHEYVTELKSILRNIEKGAKAGK